MHLSSVGLIELKLQLGIELGCAVVFIQRYALITHSNWINVSKMVTSNAIIRKSVTDTLIECDIEFRLSPTFHPGNCNLNLPQTNLKLFLPKGSLTYAPVER